MRPCNSVKEFTLHSKGARIQEEYMELHDPICIGYIQGSLMLRQPMGLLGKARMWNI